LIYHLSVLGAEVVKTLKRAGWQVVRIRGSHHLLEKSDRVVAVPVHARRELGIGLLRAIEKQTGVKLR
jgi:predicted RNA binding protein YcfA (HicA-like mRNA interferase family)